MNEKGERMQSLNLQDKTVVKKIAKKIISMFDEYDEGVFNT